MVPTVRLQNIVDALQFMSEEHSSFFAVETGEVVTISHELLEAAQDSEEEAEDPYFPDWQKPEWEDAKRISAPDGEKQYLPLPSQFEVNEWEILKDFADAFPKPAIRADLQNSIRGSGAFRCFRAAVERHGILDQWYAFKNDALAQIARDWCEENKLTIAE